MRTKRQIHWLTQYWISKFPGKISSKFEDLKLLKNRILVPKAQFSLCCMASFNFILTDKPRKDILLYHHILRSLQLFLESLIFLFWGIPRCRKHCSWIPTFHTHNWGRFYILPSIRMSQEEKNLFSLRFRISEISVNSLLRSKATSV